MSDTYADTLHPLWRGRPRDYQRAAQTAYAADEGRGLLPWSWITTTCGLSQCLNTDCMTVHNPVHILYPPGVCVYCGNPAGTRDHLMPKPRTGDAQRRHVAVVPACQECNGAINDHHAVSVAARREVAHDYLRKKYAKLLAVEDRTPDELREFGPSLRSVIRSNIEKRSLLRQRLNWPDDPDYDRYAFEKSGIDDAALLGLI